MALYRCYFLGADKYGEDIEAEALSEAIRKALVMLRERGAEGTIEILERAKTLHQRD